MYLVVSSRGNLEYYLPNIYLANRIKITEKIQSLIQIIKLFYLTMIRQYLEAVAAIVSREVWSSTFSKCYVFQRSKNKKHLTVKVRFS